MSFKLSGVVPSCQREKRQERGKTIDAAHAGLNVLVINAEDVLRLQSPIADSWTAKKRAIGAIASPIQARRANHLSRLS